MRPLWTLALAVALAASAAPSATVDDPEDLDEPTAGQLSRSITSWSPQGTVTYWSLEGSVRGLVQEKTEDSITTVTLTSDILFDFDSADVNDAAKAAIVDALADVPDGARIGIGGHTDAIGGSADNERLSEARATSVAEIVLAARPDLDATVKGFGETEPVAANEQDGEDNPAGRALNRRVEIIYAAE